MTRNSAVLFAVAGQLTDLATTWFGAERCGCVEANSLMNPIVERKRYDLLTGIKLATVALPSVLPRVRTKDKSRDKVSVNLFLLIGIAGFGAGILNLVQVKRQLDFKANISSQID